MITERVHLEPILASQIFGQVIDGLGADHMSVLYYVPPPGHGTNPIKRSMVMPTNNWQANSEKARQPGEVYAVGTPVYGEKLLMLPPDSNAELDVDYFRRVLLPHITHQPVLPGFENRVEVLKEPSMIEYDESHLCLLDFDCPPDLANTEKIIEVMGKSRFKDWSLLDSGGGYHLIVKKAGFSVPQLIQVYAEFISVFSHETARFKDHIFQSFAKDLREGAETIDIYAGDVMMHDPQKIIQTCKAILVHTAHIGEPNPENKLTFILDLRFMAYTILDLLEFDYGNESRFGSLRTTKGKGYTVPPVLIAESAEGEVVLHKYRTDPFNRGQERLPEF